MDENGQPAERSLMLQLLGAGLGENADIASVMVHTGTGDIRCVPNATWTDTLVRCWLDRPARYGAIVVVVDGQPSGEYLWRKDSAVVHEVYRADGGALDDLPTEGGSVLIFAGRHFGSNTSQHPIAASATYQSTAHGSHTYRATECTVSSDYTRISCTTAAGLGENHVWRVFVDGDVVGRAAITSYGAPAIEGVQVVGTYKPYANTEGGDVLRVLGRNFGARGVAEPTFRYGIGNARMSTWHRATGCEVLSHGEINCRSVPGVGAGLHVQIRGIGGRGCTSGECRSSAVGAGDGVEISYVPPRVVAVVTRDQHNASTQGGAIVTLTGQFFGELGSAPRVEYAVPSWTEGRPTTWEGASPLLADRCLVVADEGGSPDNVITCEMIEGGGAQLQVS